MKLKWSMFLCLLPFASSHVLAAVDCRNPRSVHSDECEVTIRVQMWNYQRIFPLLDGLFQDIDATQVNTLVLNPNTANGSQVDAVMQSVQAQIGFSKVAAAENQAAVQMMQANTASQSALLQNQTSLMTNLVSQEQASAAAQAKQAQDSNTGAGQDVLNADAALVASTGAAVSATKDAITQLTTQLAAPAYSPAASSGSIAGAVTAPPAMPTGSLIPSNTNTPSFPATKQMDNQVQLLWERLARVVGAMVKADSANPGDSLYFVQFDLGIFPISRKGRLLDVSFPMTCGDGRSDQPEVVDMFPRVAALNLSETKYRDQQWSIATALQWLGFGVNSSFSREHLQLSQVLGQSSYITGRGIGQPDFGWRYGIGLGDSEMSADTRTTFALISVPQGCTPTFDARMRWIRRNSKPADRWYSDRNETQNEGQFKSVASSELAKAFQAAQQVREDSLSVNSNPLIRTIYVNRAKDKNNNEAVNLALSLRRSKASDYSEIVEIDSGVTTKLSLLASDDRSTDAWWIGPPNQISIRLNKTHFGAGFPSITLKSGIEGDLLLNNWLKDYCPTVMSYNIVFSPDTDSEGRPLCGALIEQLATIGPAPAAPPSWLKEVRFNRTGYSTPAAPVVAVTLVLSDDLDQQTSVTADDVIIRRARDPFSRAVNSNAPTGLMESATVGANTWMTLNSRAVVLNLDSSAFGQHFPNITFTSPAGTYDLRSAFTTPTTCPEVTIAGRKVLLGKGGTGKDQLSCLDLLTSLAYKAATQHTVNSARILDGLHDPSPRIVFTDSSPSSAVSSSIASGTAPEVQISAGRGNSIWGQSAEAYEINKNGSMRRLQCDSSEGSRFSCYLAAPAGTSAFDQSLFRVVDLNHRVDKAGTIGTLESWATLEACDDTKTSKCTVPSFWDFGMEPTISAGKIVGWDLTFQFVNVPPGITLTGTLPGFTVGSQKSAALVRTPLKLQIDSIALFQHKLTDHMTLKVSCSDAPCKAFPEQSVAINNLYSHFLPVADAGSDWTNWTGSNLLSSYTRLQIGQGDAHEITCNELTRCSFVSGDLSKDSTGSISLLDSKGNRIQLLQATNGKLVNAQYVKPAAKPGVAGADAGKANAASSSIELLLPNLSAQQMINSQSKP